ncbi:benenodin family lasso peptide [Sphingosinicella sp. BN140058]|nr:benenodin family lasso peptide [Sphingosinicella sp. BN140058]
MNRDNQDLLELGVVSTDTRGILGAKEDFEGLQRVPAGLTDD